MSAIRVSRGVIDVDLDAEAGPVFSTMGISVTGVDKARQGKRRKAYQIWILRACTCPAEIHPQPRVADSRSPNARSGCRPCIFPSHLGQTSRYPVVINVLDLEGDKGDVRRTIRFDLLLQHLRPIVYLLGTSSRQDDYQLSRNTMRCMTSTRIASTRLVQHVTEIDMHDPTMPPREPLDELGPLGSGHDLFTLWIAYESILDQKIEHGQTPRSGG